MRQHLLDTLVGLVLGVVLASAFLCSAQQPPPADQLAQSQAMVSTLYRQLNAAIQDSAQQEALRGKLQQEVERLKAQVAEMQKKAPPDAKPAPVPPKESD